MADPRNKFAQPDEDTPFGRHLKEVTRYLNIGIPSFTGTYNATLPEEERWMIRVQVPGRTFAPITEPIEFSFDAPTWSLGKSMAAHIAIGRIGEVYSKDLKDYQFPNGLYGWGLPGVITRSLYSNVDHDRPKPKS